MVDFDRKPAYDIHDLIRIVAILRAPDGCPWDREQNHQSIRRNFLEEAYEVAEAIDEENPEHLREELGDVLLQVVFHAQIEQEQASFDFDAVCDGVCKKLIFRHPHIFADTQVSGTDEVLTNWEELKRQEKGQKRLSDTLESVARSLPALWRAEKVQGKAAKAGFDWPNAQGVADKLSEELGELQAAMRDGTNIEEELGDMLFTLSNLARYLSIDPEQALSAATDKFIRRVAEVERRADKPTDLMSPEELDTLWQEAKQSLKREQ